jgi:DNA-directed RNA polymerase specialized sigma24 family protein
MAVTRNNDLISNAAALWPKVVSALKFRHKDADVSIIEDAAEEAIIIFAKKIETIEHPDTPLSWLIKTAEYRYQHLRDKKKVVRLEEVVVEPSVNDPSILNFEDDDLLDEILFEMPNDDWRKSFKLTLDGYSIKEISGMMGRSSDATYKLTERAKDRAKEIASRLLAPTDRPTDRPSKKNAKHDKNNSKN